MITASWPAARPLIEQPTHARLLQDHLHRTRSQIRRIRRSGRTVRELFFYGTPQLDAATCSALLALADRLLTVGDIDTLREFLHPLIATAPVGMPQ
ncbi:hypothetical protein GCM10011609_87730 [Lentzea pudingi]|uniref:Uncharacterized protein n=1 Tax=Lentzea pudingi TaxID=1789439 RepID=A0ABQ2IXE8_9PSEU|nr:hypothetical protein [Lentzea pudingi]GGN30157.1 hypothetical protein GCM10011609_87730 [Lentzea pudingi]